MSENTEPQLTDADAERMIQMHRAGLTFEEIGRVYRVTAGIVFATLRTRMPPGELGAVPVPDL